MLLTTSGGDRPAAAGRRLCARDRARPAHADVARSAVCAAGDRRAGAALPDLADPRRRARRCRHGRRSPISARAALHWGGLLGGLVLAMSGIVLLVILNSRLVRPQRRGGADHLPAAGRSAGARIRLFLRHRAGAGRKPDRGPVQSRPRRRRRRRRAVDVGAGRDRRDRRSDPSAASARCCARSGRRPSLAPALAAIATDAVPALDRQRRSADLAAGDRDRAFLRRQF